MENSLTIGQAIIKMLENFWTCLTYLDISLTTMFWAARKQALRKCHVFLKN